MQSLIAILMEGLYRAALSMQRCYITSSDLSTKYLAVYLWCNPYFLYLQDSLLCCVLTFSQFFLWNLFNPNCYKNLVISSLSQPVEYHSTTVQPFTDLPLKFFRASLMVVSGFGDICVAISLRRGIVISALDSLDLLEIKF